MSGRCTFEGIIHNSSGKAILFQSHYWEAPLWLPRSQLWLNQDSEDEWVIRVKDWLCEKKDLMEFVQYTQEQLELMDG